MSIERPHLFRLRRNGALAAFLPSRYWRFLWFSCTLITTLLFLATCSITSAADPGTNAASGLSPLLYLHFSLDHADASYAAGEPVTRTIKLTGLNANEHPPNPTYTVTSGKTEIANGTLNFVDGMVNVTSQLDKPGVIVLKVNQKTPWRPDFQCGAAIGWQQIKSTVPEPQDFDAFWKKKLEEPAAVPANPVLEPVVDSGSLDVQLWKITMDNIRGAKIHGYLARPTGAIPLPAQLQVQYWGRDPLKKSEVVGIAKKGWLAMNIMAHDLPVDGDPAFYKEADKTGQYNVTSGADDPDKSYFLSMFLACSRAVDYLAGRSDWNKTTLLVQGGSQGGFQGIATAALNPKVTTLTIFVPGGCDQTGFPEGRPTGWPGWVGGRVTGAEREARIKTVGYYDSDNFAKRIRCPVLVGTGLIDSIATPIGQFTMFNNLPSPKRLVLMPEDEHISPHVQYIAVQAAWWKAAAAGEALPMK